MVRKSILEKGIDWGLMASLNGSVNTLNKSVVDLQGRLDSANKSLSEIAAFSANANKLALDSDNIAKESFYLSKNVLVLTIVLLFFEMARFYLDYLDNNMGWAIGISLIASIIGYVVINFILKKPR